MIFRFDFYSYQRYASFSQRFLFASDIRLVVNGSQSFAEFRQAGFQHRQFHSKIGLLKAGVPVLEALP